MNESLVNRQELRASRRKLLGIFALFAGPLFIAWLWYFNVDLLAPKLGANKGELINPAWPLQTINLQSSTNTHIQLKDLERIWTVVLVVGEHCDEQCKKNLYYTRQMRLAMGKDIERVQRLLLVPPGGTDLEPTWLAQEHPSLLVAEQGKLVQQIKTATANMPNGAHTVYLIDPLANLMMRYPRQLEPKDLMQDLKKLLKVSRIG